MREVYVSKSDIHGQGVFAARCFARGEVIMAIDDSNVLHDKSLLGRISGHAARYLDRRPNGQWVQLRPPECYVNWSLMPNAVINVNCGKRYLVAAKVIAPSCEITCNEIMR